MCDVGMVMCDNVGCCNGIHTGLCTLFTTAIPTSFCFYYLFVSFFINSVCVCSILPFLLMQYTALLTYAVYCPSIGKYDGTSHVGMVLKKHGGSNGCITRYTAITQLRWRVWLSYIASLHVQARPLPIKLERWLECSVQIANLTWAKPAFLHLLSSAKLAQ